MALPYQQPMGMGGTGGSVNPRDGITAQLMRNANPPPGGIGPPTIPGMPPQDLSSTLGSSQPPGAMQSPTGAMAPMAAMGAGAGQMGQQGLALPGMMQPGQLPQGMGPQGALGGMPQQQNAMQRPPGSGVY